MTPIRTRHFHAGLLAWPLVLLLACTSDAPSNLGGGTDAGAADSAPVPSDGAAPNNGGDAQPRDDGALPPIGSGGSDAGGFSNRGCTPGIYEGAYKCEALPGGPLVFELAVRETAVDAGPTTCQEFCPDLTIRESSGTVSGSWVVFDFRGSLSGGLNCETGEFRAELVDAQYGPPVQAVGEFIPLGPVTGEASGTYSESATEALISGPWLIAAESDCVGTFEVKLRDP